MKINPAFLENTSQFDPFEDMPRSTQAYCMIAAELALAMVRYRTEHKLTQKELGMELGMRQSQISKLEHGESNITIDRMSDVLSALHLDCVIIKRSPAFQSSSEQMYTAARSDRVSPTLWNSYQPTLFTHLLANV